MTLSVGPAAAEAAWAPLIGAWRTAEYKSCGVDDVRIGRIVTVGSNSLRVGFAHCTIESGRASSEGRTIEIAAECDLGGGYLTNLNYEWRLSATSSAVLAHEGFETRLVRCEAGVE